MAAKNGKEKNTLTMLLRSLLLHTPSILVNKKLLILVEEFKNLKKDLAKKNNANLNKNFQNP